MSEQGPSLDLSLDLESEEVLEKVFLTKDEFLCEVCGKSFETLRKKNAHKGQAHKRGRPAGSKNKKHTDEEIQRKQGIRLTTKEAVTFKYIWSDPHVTLLQDNSGNIWAARRVEL